MPRTTRIKLKRSTFSTHERSDMARPVGNYLAQVEQLEQRLNHDRGQKTPLNLLELSESMASADEELAVASHSSLLRRRFATSDQARNSRAGVAGGEALLADRRTQLNRHKQEAELNELRAALAGCSQSELQRTRAVALEGQLQLLSSVQSSAPAAHESPVVAAAVPQPTQKSDAASPKAPAPTPPSSALAATNGAATSSSSAPQSFIDDIRRMRLEAVGGAGGAELKALVGRALSALSRDLYSGAGAVLAELMQNADDSRFPAGALPTLRIRLEQGTRSLGLLVEVNECGFSESDVRAICDLGASAKVREGAAAATGRKGLGFKSVFAICETAYLRSNGFSFRFDVTDSHGLYGALVPIWVDDDEWAASLPSGGALLRNEPGTTFWLPLSRASEPPPLRLAPSTLLFLRRLRKLELHRPREYGGSLTLRRLPDDGPLSDSLQRVAIAIEGEGFARS